MESAVFFGACILACAIYACAPNQRLGAKEATLLDRAMHLKWFLGRLDELRLAMTRVAAQRVSTADGGSHLDDSAGDVTEATELALVGTRAVGAALVEKLDDLDGIALKGLIRDFLQLPVPATVSTESFEARDDCQRYLADLTQIDTGCRNMLVILAGKLPIAEHVVILR